MDNRNDDTPGSHISEIEADHIVPWSKEIHTIIENCQLLCRNCDRRKTVK